jgi:arginyl-tRNA synthetase
MRRWCSEQDLAQQKVALAMCAMNPEMRGRQYHVSYDLVKLTSGKMSGRRGRYLLADDLYSELKEVIKGKLESRFKEKGEEVSPELFAKVRPLLAAACEGDSSEKLC